MASEETIQIKVPSGVKRELAVIAAKRGETLRAVILRALKEFGLNVAEGEISDRRKAK